MNFLAHFFLDRNHPGSLFAIGAATPDLLSIFDAQIRIKSHHLKSLNRAEMNGNDHQLVEGISRHFLADKVFHSSVHFVEETKHISLLLESRIKEHVVPRKYFIAHILLELLMDKVLINLNPDILDEYYRHFSTQDNFEVVRLSTERATGKQLPNYEHFLEKFLENRYLHYYSDFDHIIYVLKRILRRVNIEENEFLNLPVFLELMMEYEKRLEEKHLVFFDEILAYEPEPGEVWIPEEKGN